MYYHSGISRGSSRAAGDLKAMRKPPRGFTLLEIMTVVFIVVLLIAILVPYLRLAKEYSKRAVCMSNHKQLIAAALQYTTDHQGQLVTASTPLSTSTPNMGWVINGTDAYSITAGLLYPYLNAGMASTLTQAQVDTAGRAPKNIKTYLCPSDLVATNARTYAINGYLNDPFSVGSTTTPQVAGGVVLTRLSQVQHPSSIIYFIDQYDNNLNTLNNQLGFVEGNPNLDGTSQPFMWGNIPGIFHLDGNNLSFADGHAEWWKWMDGRTLMLPLGSAYTKITQTNNVDLTKLQNFLTIGTSN